MTVNHIRITLFLIVSTICINNSLLSQQRNDIRADSMLLFSKKYLGTNYKYGSINPKTGFDCSGFVYYVFNHFKVKVPRSSIDYNNIGKIIHSDSCKIGDIIVFTGTNSKNRTPGHIGIITSKLGQEMQFIHSSSNKKKSGVKLSTYKESPYYEKRFLKIVRLVTIN